MDDEARLRVKPKSAGGTWESRNAAVTASSVGVQHSLPQQHTKRQREPYSEQFYRSEVKRNEEKLADSDVELDEFEEELELPNVDDLEIAAAAAEGYLGWPGFPGAPEASFGDGGIRGSGGVALMDWAPVIRNPVATSLNVSVDGYVAVELEVDDGVRQEEVSDGDSDISMGSSDFGQSTTLVTVLLKIGADDFVAVELRVHRRSTSDDEFDDKSMVGSEIEDRQMLEAMLEQMNREGGDAKAAAWEEEALQAGLKPVAPLDVEISADEKLLPIGAVSAVVDGQIVIQAPQNSRAVDEGSVLCLGDRTPLGRVEELFGPVEAPLYTLRYAEQTPLPEGFEAGTQIFGVEQLCTFLLPPAAIQASAGECGDEEEADGFDFSDDDAEAIFQKKAATMSPALVQTKQQKAGMGGRDTVTAQRNSSLARTSRGRGRSEPSCGPGVKVMQSHQQLRARQPQRGRARARDHTREGGRHQGQVSHARPPVPKGPPGTGALPPSGGQWVWVANPPAQGPPSWPMEQYSSLATGNPSTWRGQQPPAWNTAAVAGFGQPSFGHPMQGPPMRPSWVQPLPNQQGASPPCASQLPGSFYPRGLP